MGLVEGLASIPLILLPSSLENRIKILWIKKQRIKRKLKKQLPRKQ